MITIIILSSILVISSALMLLIILMQRPKQEGLGASFGGGMTQDLFGAQTTNVLQKATAYLAVVFFVVAMILAVLFNRQAEAAKSAAGLGLDDAAPAIEETTPATEESAPSEEAAPGEESADATEPVAETSEDAANGALIGATAAAVTGEQETAEESEEAPAGQ